MCPLPNPSLTLLSVCCHRLTLLPRRISVLSCFCIYSYMPLFLFIVSTLAGRETLKSHLILELWKTRTLYNAFILLLVVTILIFYCNSFTEGLSDFIILLPKVQEVVWEFCSVMICHVLFSSLVPKSDN